MGRAAYSRSRKLNSCHIRWQLDPTPVRGSLARATVRACHWRQIVWLDGFQLQTACGGAVSVYLASVDVRDKLGLALRGVRALAEQDDARLYVFAERGAETEAEDW